MASISVIIPSFNAALWIKETLQSVLQQNINDVEIIVIDDGSTDNTAGIIEREFPSVHLLKTEHQGPSKARNIGTSIAKGEFIQYLDADDVLAENKLKVQRALLERTGADVAYGDWQELTLQASGRYEKGRRFEMKDNLDEIDLFTDAWCPPAVYLFRRSIVDAVGGWNERLPIIQDARFALDCALRGGRFIYQKSITAYYRHSSTISLSRRDPEQFIKDCLYNAYEVEEWWQTHGGISVRRKEALLTVYGFVARQSFKVYPGLLQEAYRRLARYAPRYIPAAPPALKYASWVFGYRNAELLAYYFRVIKNFFSRHR